MMSTTVILGGGAFGSSVAYHLALCGRQSIVVEQQEVVANGASGRAAGFLASTWGDGKVTENLHKFSCEMHEQLASTLGLQTYRKGLTAINVDLEGSGKGGLDTEASLIPSWIDGRRCDVSVLDRDAAQVSPAELCGALLREAQASGLCTVRTSAECVGIVTKDSADADDAGGSSREATAVRLASGEELSCDHLVVALGAWSCKIEDWFGVPLPVDGVLSTSFTFDNAPEELMKQPAAVFCAEDSRGCHLEVYARPNGEVYVSGCGESKVISSEVLRCDEVPPSATNRPDDARAAAAERSLAALSSVLAPSQASDEHDAVRPRGAGDALKPDVGSPVRQACMRPCAPDGLPIVGPVPGVRNTFVATGGNVWGITWAPAVGKLVSEMVVDGGSASSLNMRPFSPRRFDTLTYRTLLKQRGRERSGSGRVGEQW